MGRRKCTFFVVAICAASMPDASRGSAAAIARADVTGANMPGANVPGKTSAVHASGEVTERAGAGHTAVVFGDPVLGSVLGVVGIGGIFQISNNTIFIFII